MRDRIFHDASSSGHDSVVEAWLRKWRPAITVFSEQLGCGRHHDLCEIDAPEVALAGLRQEFRKKRGS